MHVKQVQVNLGGGVFYSCLGRREVQVKQVQVNLGGGVFYSCLGRREGAYNPCPKWARIYRLMTESGSKAFPASRAPEV